MSPLLFNILIADLEVMGKAKWEGVRLLGERVYTLSYADDIINRGRGRNEEHNGKIRGVFR